MALQTPGAPVLTLDADHIYFGIPRQQGSPPAGLVGCGVGGTQLFIIFRGNRTDVQTFK